MAPFDTLLVANRGEIACRILRTAHDLGLRTVAVFSEADAHAPHVALADEAVLIGPAPARQSYLDPARLLDAARRTGAQALHPGYGFLSEDAAFARAVQDAGLVWVGPPPDAIHAMGDKARAKALMRAAGVPCVPGFDADDPDDEALLQAAEAVGYPLLVKATAGGGGRGMRRVHHPDDLLAALRGARSEAASAFGAGGLLLERLITDARHIEVQVFADAHGGVLHLGERDCSVQRRHQKVIEEAPSPAVDEALRARLGAVACAAARAVGYIGAGTVEMLLDADRGEAYFLEMNTRLQVEHPVTEAITGLDLVAWQLRVAAGEPLPLTQAQVTLQGHAIEARLYAESPAHGYSPRTGRLRAFVPPPARPGVRIDHGIRAGQAITADYDPMLAKVIAYGPDRQTARRRLLRALAETVLIGVETNQRFLGRVLAHPTFVAGAATTRFLEASPALTEEPAPDPEGPLVAVALWLHTATPPGADLRQTAHPRPQAVALSLDGAPLVQDAQPLPEGGWKLGGKHVVSVEAGDDAGWRRVLIDGISRRVFVCAEPDTGRLWLVHRGAVLEVGPWQPPAAADASAEGADGRVRAPTAGRVLAVSAAVGDRVALGAAVVVVEAMKLESTLVAGVAGTVAEVRVAPGDSVSAGQVVVVISPDEVDNGGA